MGNKLRISRASVRFAQRKLPLSTVRKVAVKYAASGRRPLRHPTERSDSRAEPITGSRGREHLAVQRTKLSVQLLQRRRHARSCKRPSNAALTMRSDASFSRTTKMSRRIIQSFIRRRRCARPCEPPPPSISSKTARTSLLSRPPSSPSSWLTPPHPNG